MLKAYDTFLQSEVSADLAAKSSGFEPYRYECARCGEEVHLAAVGSIYKAPHFRHLSGNNDVECENYLGQYGAISTDCRTRQSTSERAEFYFDRNTKMFSLGLRFSDDEINFHELRKTTFELRTSTQEKAFFSLLINSMNFVPDALNMIPISKFAYNYFLSNTLTGIKRKYEVFKSNYTPTFFKIQGNDDSNYKAKLVRNTVLYTNVPYFVAFESQHSTLYDRRLPIDIKVEDIFQFKTMGRTFLGKRLTIKNKTVYIDSLLESWGYQLRTSETLTLIWPPAAIVNDVSSVGSNNVYIYSSFELQAHGNINVYSKDIKKITDGISRVSVNSKIRIYKENAEITIDKNKQHSSCFDSLSISKSFVSVYIVPDNSSYFLFNRSGVMPLSEGQSVSLTPRNLIRHYLFGYLDGYIYPQQQKELMGEQLLNDMLIHYKLEEVLDVDTFDSDKFSDIAFQYLEKCEASGFINSAAKRFIMEGWL
jgi:hypothetical protein